MKNYTHVFVRSGGIGLIMAVLAVGYLFVARAESGLIALRPTISALSISSADTTAATVDLNCGQFVTIDGRPGGIGWFLHIHTVDVGRGRTSFD